MLDIIMRTYCIIPNNSIVYMWKAIIFRLSILSKSRYLNSIVLIGILIAFTVSTHFSIELSVYAQSPTTTLPGGTSWVTGKANPVPKMESAYTAVGDKIYIIAGYGETGKRNKNTVEVYDTKTDTWSNASPLPVNLNHAAADAYNNKIYVVGGFLDNKIPSNKLFVYDPSQDKWLEGKAMPTARASVNCSIH